MKYTNINLVTGYAGYGHIKSHDIAAFNAGVIGTAGVVLDTGEHFSAEGSSSSTAPRVLVHSGDAIWYGRHISISEGDVAEADITIPEEIGYYRRDVIAFQMDLFDDGSYGLSNESARLVAIRGQESTSDNVPAPAIQAAKYFPLCTVRVNRVYGTYTDVMVEDYRYKIMWPLSKHAFGKTFTINAGAPSGSSIAAGRSASVTVSIPAYDEQAYFSVQHMTPALIASPGSGVPDGCIVAASINTDLTQITVRYLNLTGAALSTSGLSAKVYLTFTGTEWPASYSNGKLPYVHTRGNY